MPESWQEFEALAERIYRALSPDAVVRAGEQILGKSGAMRKIDVSIRTRAAGQDLLVIVDAKKHKKKVSMEQVSAFAGQVEDVRASKGVMISDSGYTGGAIKVARDRGVDLCSAIEASSRPWTRDLSIPVLFYENELSFEICFETGPFDERAAELNRTTNLRMAFGRTVDKKAINWSDELCRLWNDSHFSREAGQHSYRYPEGELEAVLAPGLTYPSSVEISYQVDQSVWLKRLAPDEYLGSQSVLSEKGEIYAKFNLARAAFCRDGSWAQVDDVSALCFARTAVIHTFAQFDPRQVLFGRTEVAIQRR
jgi:hypothetical protein